MRKVVAIVLAALVAIVMPATRASAQAAETCTNSAGAAVPKWNAAGVWQCAGSVPATQSPYTPLTPMQSGLTVASSTALTVPATANYAVVCAYGQAVNYTWDGTTTPTTTSSGVGMQLAAGTCIPLVGATVISNFRAIQQSATATLSVSYAKQ